MPGGPLKLGIGLSSRVYLDVVRAVRLEHLGEPVKIITRFRAERHNPGTRDLAEPGFQCGQHGLGFARLPLRRFIRQDKRRCQTVSPARIARYAADPCPCPSIEDRCRVDAILNPPAARLPFAVLARSRVAETPRRARR